MTTDPREVPLSREEKKAAMASYYDVSKVLVTETPKAKPVLLIGFNNNGGKMHGTYRCGMSRTNKVHNTPFIVTFEEEHACKRCGGPSTEATHESIEAAWTETYRGSQRSPWGGMDETYIVSQMMQMQDRFATENQEA